MCNKSETIGKIAAALVAFSGEVRIIEKDATNPHFKSAYTTLDHMIDVTKPLLHKHGLTVMQFPGGDGEKVTVKTMILHASGEWIESEALTLKATKLDPQGAGSAVTYARRYSYAAALSLSLGDDDDANGVSTPPTRTEYPKQANTPTQPQKTTKTTSSAPSGDVISQAQVNYALKLKKEKHINDADFRRMISEHNGDENGDVTLLTRKQASEFINFLNNFEMVSA